MAVKRKKTLAELMQERTQGITDTSAYTTKPMPRATSNTTTGNTNNDTWNRVLSRTNQIMSNTSVRNSQMANPNSNIISSYIGMNKGIERDKKFQEEMKKQALERERNTLAKIAEKSNQKMKEGNLLEKADAVVSTAVLGLGQGGASAVGNTTGAIYNIVEGIANKAGIKTEKKKDMGANFSPISSKDYTNMIKQNEAVMSEYGSNLKNGLGTVNTVSNIIGNMLVSAGTGGDKVSRIASAVTSGSQGYMQALNEKQDNKLKAGITGGLKGIITYNLEGLTGGNFMGKGSFDDFATKAISKMSKKEITKKAMSKLYEVFGENIEENAENALGHIVDVALGNEEVPTIDQLIKETLETTKDTTLTTAILSLFGLGGNTYNDVKLYEMKQEQIKNSGLDEKTQQKLNDVAQKYDLSSEDIQNLIDNTKNGKYDEKQPSTIENNPISEQSQQVISNEGKIAENATSQGIKENDKYAIKMPNSNYKFVKSGDEKIDNFRQDASQNWNNSKDTQKLVSTIETIMKDKGVAVRLDANLKDSDGNIADGKYENGTITINPNSKRAFEYIATHELTHAIGTKQMLDMVQRYRQDNKEFNSKVETLLKNYNATELTEEALADVSAQLFGTQEFINSVKNTNPNLFQKIYNEIKYLWHQFRGYKNQNQFVEDLYNKWTQAYRNNNKLNDTTNYYIEPVAKFNEIEYNNVIEEKLSKKEYAILRSIINSDSNIKPGINYVEVTNGRYTVYYKGFDDFKVMSRKVDADAGRINKRNDTTGRKTRYSKTFEQSIRNEGTTASNDEVSNFNTPGTRERSGSNTSSSTNIKNDINLSTQESENNSGSFNLQKDNKGRDLSKEQQERFKDSKARDKDGNLKTLYHGTPNEFNIFNYDKLGTNTSSLGAGFYFTDNEATGKEYSRGDGYVKEVYLDIKKPMKYEQTTITKKEFRKFVDAVNEATEGRLAEDYGDLNYVEMEYDYGGDDIDLVNSIHNASGLSWEKTYEILRDSIGYDGLIEENFLNKGETIYVAFNPNQIKNVDNTNPTDNPDIRYLKENTEWQEYLEENFKTEGTRTTKEQIGLPKETDMPESIEVKLSKLKKESEDLKQRRNTIENMDIFEMSSEDWLKQTEELNKITDRETVLNSKIEELENIPDTLNNIVRNRKENKTLKEKVSESNAKFQKAFVNQYYEIDKIANKTNNKKLSIALDNWIGAKQQVQTAIDGNTKFGTGQTNNEGKVIGESVTQILKDVYKKKDIINLTDYMQNRLNIERSKHKKANLDVTPEQSQAIVERYEKQKPYLKEVADKLYKLYDNVLQNCVDAGLGTSDLKNAVREMYPSYMPIYKNISELTNFIDSGEINNKMIKKAVGGQTDILAIDVATAEYVMGMNRKIQLNKLLVELKNSLEKNNELEDYVNTEQPSDLEDFASDKQKKINEMIMQTADGENIATCYIDGMAHQFKISDEIYNLLKPQDIKQTKFGEELISSANNLFRKMVTTYNPFFTLRNMVKDFQNGCYNTKYGAPTYVKNYFKGIKEIILNGELSKLYRNSGLQGNTKYSKSKGILSSKSANFVQKYNPISLTNNIIDFINTNIETMGRMSEFISAIESGKDLNEARYEASEITLNFKRGGETSKTITKWGGTFFNSSILAVEKTIKNVTGKNGKKGLANFIVMGLASGVGLSILNHLVYRDDDDYEELPDYIKDGYWLIKKNDGSGTFYRIAKDQITTAIGSSVRRIYQMATGEEDIGELEDMFKAIFENIGVENPITSNIYAPIVQAISGKTWYDGDLISEYQETLAPELQYDYRTNEISKWTANQIAKLPEGVKSTLKGLPIAKQAYDIASSPKKSDYVMQQYLGGVGKLLLPTVTPYAEQSYIEKEMQTNSVLKSKYPSMVYDEFDKAEIEYNSYGTNQDKYLYLTEAKKQLSDFYTQIRETENDTTLTNEEKRDKEYQIRKELNRTAKDIINNLENVTSKTNSSSIGDKEYYKDTEGKYKTISDEEKIEGISTETYATYRNELTKATEKKRKEENDEEATLNKKEKVAIINNSKYTSEEKKAMYEKTYGNQDTTFKYLNKITDINIDAYLDYISEEIKADDDPNSKIKGKTISGSKKKNLKEYLNNPDNGLSYIERLYIYGRSYGLDRNERQTITNAVKKAGLTSKEQKEFYLTLHDVYEEEDGTIKWK